jgi:hypothetical protein
MKTFAIGVLILSISLSACGGGDAPAADQETAALTEEAVQDEMPLVEYDDPEVLAGVLLDNYYSAYGDLAALVAGNPPAAELKPLVAELKNRYIGIFVELGSYYEAMDATARSTVDARVGVGFGNLNMDYFNAVSQAITYYRAEDSELADMMVDFNIITQYAFYDLLRRQDPEEAVRLGI